MDTLGSILNRTNLNRPILKQARAALIVETANEFITEHLGQALASNARAVYYKNNILTVACLSSVAAQEIRLNETKLLKQLNSKYGLDAVKKVRYLA